MPTIQIGANGELESAALARIQARLASEWVRYGKPTRLRVVLVFPPIDAEGALSNSAASIEGSPERRFDERAR